MRIEERFEDYLQKVKGLSAVMLLDHEGETVIMAKRDELDEFDIQLFGAQAAVLLAKRLEGQKINFLFLKGDGRSAATRLLDNDYFLCMYFAEQSFAGYAEKWLDDLAIHVKEEFF